MPDNKNRVQLEVTSELLDGLAKIGLNEVDTSRHGDG